MGSSTYEDCYRLCWCRCNRNRGLLCVLGLVALGKPIWWLLPGVFSLIAFAYLLTFVEAEAAGRAYATYGGIYIVASLLWL